MPNVVALQRGAPLTRNTMEGYRISDAQIELGYDQISGQLTINHLSFNLQDRNQNRMGNFTQETPLILDLRNFVCAWVNNKGAGVLPRAVGTVGTGITGTTTTGQRSKSKRSRARAKAAGVGVGGAIES